MVKHKLTVVVEVGGSGDEDEEEERGEAEAHAEEFWKRMTFRPKSVHLLSQTL